MIKILNVPSLYASLLKVVDFCKDNEKENIEIVVPDKLSLFMEKFLFERMQICASFNIKVSTFNRFAKRTIDIEKSKQISKIGSILLIHKILNENFDKMQVLNSKAYSFTYAENIFRTISQFKASKITSDELANFSSTDMQLNGKIKDLALVYSCYEKEKAGLLDASDLFLMSTFYIVDNKENSKIVFVGFDDFTAIEYSLIERLACATEVYVLNNYSNSNNKHIYNNEIISQLKNIAYINGLPFEIEDCLVTVNDTKNFLQSNIYALKNEEYVLTDEIIKIYSAKNVAGEIEFVARDIRQKVLNGARFDDFGVAIYDLQNYTNIIKQIFEKYEINYYIDSEIEVNNSVLYKFFTSILKFNLDGYNLSNLIDIINSPFFAIENNLKKQIIEKLIAINYRGKVNKDISLKSIDEDVLKFFINFMLNIQFEKDIDCKDLINKFKDIYLTLNVSEIINNLANDDIKTKILLNKSCDVIFSLFDEILKYNNSINADMFYDIFISSSQVVKVNNLPLSLDCVKIVDANNTMEVFKDFYILNMTTSNAPNLKFDCGIILDTEIEKLNFTHKLNPTIAHINRLSKLRLFNTLLLFENELTLTYSNNPSEVIKELCNKVKVETQFGNINIEPISETNFEKYVALSKWDYIEFLTKYEKNNLKIFNDLNYISATTLENYFKCPFYMFLTNTLKIKPRLDSEILSLDIGNLLHEIMFKYYKLKKQVGDVYTFCRDEIFAFVDKDERLKLNVNSPILINLIDEAVRVISAIDYIDDNSLFEPKYFEKEFKNETALKLKNINIIGKVDRVDVYNDMFRIIDYKSGKADASLKELFYGNKLQLFLYSCAMEKVLNKSVVGSFYLPLHNAYTKDIINPFSLKGFYLAEDFVVKAFDKRLEPGDKSDIVNVKLNKSNTVTKTIGYKELESADLTHLKNYSKTVSEKAIDEIKSGYIAPNPSEISKPCDYCPYVHICMKNSCNIAYRKAKKVNLDSFKEAQDE